VVIIEEVVKAAAACGQEEVLKIIEERFMISPSKEQWSIAQFYNAAKSGKEEGRNDLEIVSRLKPAWF